MDNNSVELGGGRPISASREEMDENAVQTMNLRRREKMERKFGPLGKFVSGILYPSSQKPPTAGSKA